MTNLWSYERKINKIFDVILTTIDAEKRDMSIWEGYFNPYFIFIAKNFEQELIVYMSKVTTMIYTPSTYSLLHRCRLY